MHNSSFSEKQLVALSWWHPQSKYFARDGIICDGAVRSGKTYSLSLGFCLWAMSCFSGACFAFCGKSIKALRRNLIDPVLKELVTLGYHYKERAALGYLDIFRENRSNRFYLFDGYNEASAARIQGVTLCGVLLDEVALMPRSFVEQALARCSQKDARFWFSCNPEHPGHWFYTEWIQKAKEKNLLYLHFTMQDNPALSLKIRQRYERLYSGNFYERFVLGKWVAAQGVIYPMFDPKTHVFKEIPDCSVFYISCDYGTVNPMSMGLWGESDGVWYRIAEYYYDSKKQGTLKTDEEYYQALDKLAADREIAGVVVDPSAASFIACIRKHGRFTVFPAQNDVANGIRLVGNALQEKKLRFHESCTDLLREFSLYRWDEQTGGERPVKQFDHAMDEMRYFAATVLENQTNSGFFAAAVARE